MIDKKELRIGNYVQSENLLDVFGKVSEIQENTCTVSGVWTSYELIDPILIDQKWLEHFGFREDGFGQRTKTISGNVDMVVRFNSG